MPPKPKAGCPFLKALSPDPTITAAFAAVIFYRFFIVFAPGSGIIQKDKLTFIEENGLPHQSADWFAMTRFYWSDAPI